jgi:hypothetical protein
MRNNTKGKRSRAGLEDMRRELYRMRLLRYWLLGIETGRNDRDISTLNYIKEGLNNEKTEN